MNQTKIEGHIYAKFLLQLYDLVAPILDIMHNYEESITF